jgi:hypothetical protein
MQSENNIHWVELLCPSAGKGVEFKSRYFCQIGNMTLFSLLMIQSDVHEFAFSVR